MQSDCENTGVSEDSHFAIFLAFAHHSMRQRLQKPFKIGLLDVPKPVQKALRIEFRFGSASMTDLQGSWTLKWPPPAGP